MSRGFKWSLVVILLLLLGVAVGPIASVMLPGWNCTKDEINIKTGQGRHSRYLAFIRVFERTYNTPLSEALAGRINAADIADWQTVNTFAPPSRRYSPHYRFHGALSQAQAVGFLVKSSPAASSSRAEIAKTVLVMWQTNGSDSAVDNYIYYLWEQVARESRTMDPTVPPEAGAPGVQ